jgi:hypothetical protein
MNYNEANQLARQWITDNGYQYNGVLSGKGKIVVGYDISISHQGIKDYPAYTLWCESFGDGATLSKVLDGFISILYACNSGLTYGVIAVPQGMTAVLSLHRDFIISLARSVVGNIGILNLSNMSIGWLNTT